MKSKLRKLLLAFIVAIFSVSPACLSAMESSVDYEALKSLLCELSFVPREECDIGRICQTTMFQIKIYNVPVKIGFLTELNHAGAVLPTDYVEISFYDEDAGQNLQYVKCNDERQKGVFSIRILLDFSFTGNDIRNPTQCLWDGGISQLFGGCLPVYDNGEIYYMISEEMALFYLEEFIQEKVFGMDVGTISFAKTYRYDECHRIQETYFYLDDPSTSEYAAVLYHNDDDGLYAVLLPCAQNHFGLDSSFRPYQGNHYVRY